MADCRYASHCRIFEERMRDMPSLAKVHKNRYCYGAPESCARHRVYAGLGRAACPPGLFPNQADVATQMLSQK